MTPAQRRALEELLPRYGVPAEPAVLDFDVLFGRTAPAVLEIGFGNGEALLHMAGARPDTNFLGIEVHRPGVGQLLMGLERAGIENVRVLSADANEILTSRIADASLDAIYLFFPDPWPKLRHHKRRLVQLEFVDLVAAKLRFGGEFHIATDWQDYARHALETVAASRFFVNTAGPGHFAARPAHRPMTKFERRGQRLGHSVWDLIFRRVEQAG